MKNFQKVSFWFFSSVFHFLCKPIVLQLNFFASIISPIQLGWDQLPLFCIFWYRIYLWQLEKAFWTKEMCLKGISTLNLKSMGPLVSRFIFIHSLFSLIFLPCCDRCRVKMCAIIVSHFLFIKGSSKWHKNWFSQCLVLKCKLVWCNWNILDNWKRKKYKDDPFHWNLLAWSSRNIQMSIL